LTSAFVFAFYVLYAERAVAGRDTITLLAWGFLFATVFWTVVQPWWSFPAGRVGQTVSLGGHLGSLHLPAWALVLWVVVLGTIVPFVLVVGALRHISATRAGVTGMLEPVVATLVAWIWLGETLSVVQLVGAGVVLAGILLAQTAR
jgi:drug/metabolite transporter (DMT)-like permease